MKHPFLIEKTKKRVKWTQEEDSLLISLANVHERKWRIISASLQDKTGYDCYLRYRSINPDLKKGSWEPAEDQKIIEGMKVWGRRWSRIASSFFSNRNAKQIRERYTNYLDTDVKKGKFSINEDVKILQMHNKYGNKWSFIKLFIPGRSSDSIKNRFNSSIKRNKKLFIVINTLNSDMVSLLLIFLIYNLFNKKFNSLGRAL
jgi:myb proto-oncogene protein